MEDFTAPEGTDILSNPEDTEILHKITAFYYFKKKGIDVVEKVYPDLVGFVREHDKLSYEQVKSALFSRFRY